MNIWLIKTGEPLPSDGENTRLFRTGKFANYLSSKGHNVIWWSSVFDHQGKKHRTIPEVVSINDNFSIKALKSDGYEKNISFKRIKEHRQVAREFRKRVDEEQKPDLILCSFPTIELCIEAVKFAKKSSIPILIDIRDLWPDIFIEHIFPKSLKPIGKVFIWPFMKSVKKIMSNATGLISISKPMLNWGLNYAERLETKKDMVVPFGYLPRILSSKETENRELFFRKVGIFSKEIELRICLFATLSNSFNILTIIAAAKELEKLDSSVQFVICGSGEKLKKYKQMTVGMENIFFPGWVDFPTILYLKSISDIGIAPYINTPDFAASIPNKAVEYLSGGLPILTSIDGHLTKIIKKNNCGWFYKNDHPKLLANLILKIKMEQNELIRMKKNAINLFETRFEENKVNAKLESHIKYIIESFG